MSIFSKQEFISSLTAQLQAYPKMQPQDIVKWCYQQAFGSSHFCDSDKATFSALFQEIEYCSPNPKLAVLEPLNTQNRGFRLSLAAAKAAGLSPALLAKAFILDSKTTPQNPLWFAEALQCLALLADQQFFPFDGKEMLAYLSAYKKSGCPMVSHSQIFHAAYQPHYLIFCGQVSRLLPLILEICEKQALLSAGQRISVALDGLCASGKTTAAQLLSDIFGGDVVHMDDFFLPLSLRKRDRLAQAGGNIHYERFSQQVAPHLTKAVPFSYPIFNCSVMDFSSIREISSCPILFVEGAYALHPACEGSYALSAFFEISPALQKQRILQRNGGKMWKNFHDLWIPMEHRYSAAFQIPSKVDFIIE